MNRFIEAKRIVVKVGSSTLTHPSGGINLRRMDELVKVLADIKNSGREIILVSSGAVAAGVGKLGLGSRPADIPGKQACAAVGQSELMYLYDKGFGEYNHSIGQVLLTYDAIEHSDRRRNIHNTFERLLEMGVIPIVNENDTVSVDEIKIGDNDTLSAEVAILTGSDVLIIFSDIDGLYTANPADHPDARLVPLVTKVDENLMSTAGGAGSNRGTGGMQTKLTAARRAGSEGIDMAILNGSRPHLLYDLLEGKEVGTRFELNGPAQL
ncbi:MAG: glutamate 5-kinase [Oscillospiraceae bacterium]|nr:glutamate 5-kinase [Oscillospiraceae bacterium]